MDVRYEDDFEDETNEELGAMVMAPLVGVHPSPKTSTTHSILVQLENDIERKVQENLAGKPINKLLINQFKAVQEKGQRIQQEKDKED
jgi:hypothetical protein